MTNNPSDPRYFHAVTKMYPVAGVPDRVTVQVHIRPMGLDVIQDLATSGDLDAATAQALPTFTLSGTQLEWKTGNSCVP